MPALSVIIVTFNHSATLRLTLETLLAQQGADFEVIVFDNNSTDDSLAIAREFLPRGVRVVASRANRGYCGGNNDAAALSRGNLLLLCNPDIEFHQSDTLARLIADYEAEPTLAIVGFKLLAADRKTLLHCGGEIDLPAHTPLRGHGQLDEGQFDTPAEVDFVEGSALAISRAAWNRLHGLDEIYWPAFYEETDFCVRARRLGIRVTYLPGVCAIHHAQPEPEHVVDGWFWRTLQTNRIIFTLRTLGIWRFIFEGLPAEWRWLSAPGMKYLRRGVYRSYLRAARRLLWRVLGKPIAPAPDYVELSASDISIVPPASAGQ